MKRLSDITSYLFEDHIIISLSKDWINVFKAIPEFEVIIDNKKRLHLISKNKVKNEKEIFSLTEQFQEAV